MKYISYYNSPLGKILLASDEIGLFGAWFENQKYYADIDLGDAFSEENDTLNKAKKWLDNYFQKQQNNIDIPLHIDTANASIPSPILNNINSIIPMFSSPKCLYIILFCLKIFMLFI